jgi:hypothetical protein
LRDELDLGQGIQPGTKPLPATRINPDRAYAPGGSVMALSPRDMQAELFVGGKDPIAAAQRRLSNPQASTAKPQASLAKRLGKRALQGVNAAAVPLGLYSTMEESKELGRRLASKDYSGAANKAFSTAGSAIGTLPYVGLLPGLGLYALGEGLDYASGRYDEQPTPRNPDYEDEYTMYQWLKNAGLLENPR